MKLSKGHARLSTRSPLRSVSLQFRDNQVIIRVKTPVPQCKPQMSR